MSQRRSEAILELGRRLAAQLDAEDDLLVSWMAHYIAELIDATAKAPPETKATAQESCASAILRLWRHRASMPAEVRPLVEIDAILATLASLDDDRTDYRYYPEALRGVKATETEEKTKKWLVLALDVDFMARRLIKAALQSAAESASAKTKPWVDLLQEAGATQIVEASIVELAREPEGEGMLDEARRRELTATLQRLRSVARIASALAEDVRSALGTAETDEPEVDGFENGGQGDDHTDNNESSQEDVVEPDDLDDSDEPE